MVISPVTGIFAHESTDVWALRFENGDTLGVTGSHPIYSLDANDWVLVSTLSPGNQVLTKSGHATVTSVKKIAGRQKVYNLEVKDWHNFLVGDLGVVVHNGCTWLKSKFGKYSKWHKTHPDDWLDNSKVENMVQQMLNNDPSIYSQPIYTTTKNGKSFMIDGHHRLKAAKRVKSEYGIDIELQHMDVNPANINAISPYNSIDDLINDSYLPND